MADASNLANLIQQLAYSQAGGQPQGQRDIDKLNTLGTTVKTGSTDLMNSFFAPQAAGSAIIKNVLEAQKAKYEGAKAAKEAQPDPEITTPVGKLNPTEFKNYNEGLYYGSGGKNPGDLPVSALPESARKRALAAGFALTDNIPVAKFNALKGDPSISPYADEKTRTDILSSLPSKLGQTTTAGAAAQVQLAVRQGMGLIAKPGAPQQIALAASDLARAVQRSAPLLDTLQSAGFADNIYTKLSLMAQHVTANPQAKDVPRIRKQLYGIFKELQNTSEPMVARELNHIENIYKDKLPPNWQTIRADELGQNFPDIPFQETADQQAGGGLTDPAKEARYQELLKKQQAGILQH